MKLRTRLRPLPLLIAAYLFAPCALHAQAATASPSAPAKPSPATSIEPGPKPPDAPGESKELLGVYKHDNDTVVILERHGKLYWQALNESGLAIAATEEIRSDSVRGLLLSRSGLPDVPLSFQTVGSGQTATLTAAETTFIRTDGGSDPSRFYHINPSRPIAELRAAALAAEPPVEAEDFRKPDLVELVTLDPAVHLDIRYAQSNNFLSTPVYTQARAFMQRPAAEALVRVSHKLRPLGYGLLVHDAYRPWYVTKIFWDATPPEGKQFVANPKEGSKHNRGCAVDLTLYDLSTGKPVEMPGLYDEMSPRSFPTFPGGTSLQRWNRELLRRAMESEGFAVNESEWWHFDYKEWKHYPIMNVPFEELGRTRPPASNKVH